MTDSVPAAETDLPDALRWFAPWRWKRGRWLLLLICLPVYPLSIGPVIWLYQHQWISPTAASTLEQIYSPLKYLHDSIPPVGFLLDRYINFWNSLP